MQQIRKLSRSFKERAKLIINIWQNIKQFIEKLGLPQPLQDTIFVFSLIVLLGTTGWIEYNFKAFTDNKNEAPPITLRLIPSLGEKTESVLRPSSSEVTSLTFNPSSKTLVSGSLDGTISLFDMQTEPIKLLPTSQFSTEGITDTIQKKNYTNESQVWSLAFIFDSNSKSDSEPNTLISVHEDIFKQKDFSQEEKQNDKSGIGLWKVSSSSKNQGNKLELNFLKMTLLEDRENAFWPFAFSFDGQFLASDSESDGIIKLWKYNEKTNKFEQIKQNPMASISNNTPTITAVAFNKNNDIVVSGNDDGTIRLWRISSDKNNFSYVNKLNHGTNEFENQINNEISVLTFSSTENYSTENYLLASGSSDGTIKLWKLKKTDKPNFKADEKFITLKHPKEINSLAFSHNGQILASGSDDGSIKLWDLSKVWKLSKVEEIRTLRSHPDAITSLVFSPDDKTLASGSADETIKIWQANSKILAGWRQPPLLRLSTMAF